MRPEVNGYIHFCEVGEMAELIERVTGEKLEDVEKEINEASFEAFFHIGKRLADIRRLRLYEQAGYKSWSAYCAAGRLDYRKAQADSFIRCSELRPKLDGIPSTIELRMWHLVELAKCETDNDAKRVAKKAIALATKTKQPLTAKLIAQVRDGDDETGAAGQRQDAELQSATMAKHMEKFCNLLTDWRTSFEEVVIEQRGSVPPVLLARAKSELKALLKVLEGF